MFPKNSNSQAVWASLSFLVLGLGIGLLVASKGEILENFGGNDLVRDETESAIPPDFDVNSLEIVDVSTDDDAVLGDADAPVTIVEFSDFQCPYCSRFYEQTLPQILSKYIEKGKVKLVYRDFPLSGHPQANLAAQAAECTGDENYYAFHDWLFENVATWSGKETAMEIMIQAAEDELGADIRTCLENGEMADEVNADMMAGRSYGVTGTPAFFINGKKLVGAWPYEVFEAVIESEL
ncbi:MAG: DsbA family protein [Candidatus Gracilibacteria bacterium]